MLSYMLSNWQALKEGKSTSEIDCSRNIVERTVTLNRDSDFKANREDQGIQLLSQI